jgi:23S rRNA (adenine2503-C2)-methyltransferase
MRNIYDLTLDNLKDWAKEHQLPTYRASQIYQWVARGVSSADEMTNLPAGLRKQLSESFTIGGLTMADKHISKIDGTIKYIFRLRDGNTIESVLMKYKHGYSVCISSQAGCRMGCTFCASTGAGFGRNLSHGEMLAQIAQIGRDCGERIGHVVIMGIGEPFDNYENLIRFLKTVNDPSGLHIGLRHISVSTCGLVPDMLKFTDEGFPVTLSVSLHAPNQQIRSQLMPIARLHDYDKLIAACKRHADVTGRRISFEYTMFKGVNDRPEHARELAARLKGILCHVNLIAANELEDGIYQASERNTMQQFMSILMRSGVNATIRRELGTDIMAACGQLRRRLEACEKP